MGDEDYFDSIFATLDSDGSGLVEKAEMVEFVKRMHGELQLGARSGMA